jgi:molybdenum cofactor synthesis domain-containing protein
MTEGKLRHVCISATKGVAKHEIGTGNLLVDYGMEGDAHAGNWHRQVSLLAHLDIESMRAKGLHLTPGAFGENLVLDGLDIGALGAGSQLRIGPVLLELTQVGKVCHTRCAIYYKTGDCIMPRLGLFARVLEGGALRAGMDVCVVRAVPRAVIQAAVLTVSDRCAAGTTIDTAGPAVAALLHDELQARIAWTGLAPDEAAQIEACLTDFCDRRVDVVLTVGGTGLSPRDITPEVTRKVMDREVPGLAEAMRAASAEKTPHAWLSRAVAGVRRETLIVNLPGSLRGATENLRALLPVLPHAVKMLRNDAAHPESDRGRLIRLEGETETPLPAAPLAEVR